MSRRMVGVETEYAIVALDGRGSAIALDRPLRVFVQVAQETLPHLPGGHGADLFLQNGMRLYVDCGSHPEVSSPECQTPWDLVRYARAGDRLLAEVRARTERDPRARNGAEGGGLRSLSVLKCNVDYSGSNATWGSHESYLHRADPRAIPRQILPHLVTRLIYTGAGGFDPRCYGIEFLLSPRVAHLVRVVSSSSTGNRGIVHSKDETLSSPGYHRLHLICGESLCSEMALWLRVGTTALVVAMAEAGLKPGEAVELCSPLEAMRALAADPTCRAEVPLAKGPPTGAIAIQRHYLAMAEAHLRASFMPPWAGEVCREWRRILDRLEADPSRLARTLDWAIKLELFRSHARRRGVAWESFPAWNRGLALIRAALRRTEYRRRQVRVEFVIGPESPIPTTIRRLTPYLERRGLCWEQLRPFMDLRQELFELDLRFGELGERGLFAALERAGRLSHEAPGVERIEEATHRPPDGGRARVRGEVIRRFAGRENVRCGWSGVWDIAGHTYLDLSDPFAEGEIWKNRPVGRDRFGLSEILADLF